MAIFEPAALVHNDLSDVRRIIRLQRDAELYLAATRTWSQQLRRQSAARNIRASNSIEGYNASVDDARAIADGEEPLDLDSETQMAYEGYTAAMTYVLARAGDATFTFTVEWFKSVHFLLMRQFPRSNPGRWRPGSIFVRNDRTGDVVYNAPDVTQVDELMGELVDSLNQGLADLNGQGQQHPIITAAMAHLNLVMIHPYSDGNGRMARIVQAMVLARYAAAVLTKLAPEYLSIEEYLGANTADYYRVLERTGQGHWNPHRDTGEWLRFCLWAHTSNLVDVLQRARLSEMVWETLSRLPGIADARPAEQERLLTALIDAASGSRLRRGTYRAAVKDSTGKEISDVTAARDLARLTNLGYLHMHGRTRGSFYLAAEPIDLILAETLSRVRHPSRAGALLLDPDDPRATARPPSRP